MKKLYLVDVSSLFFRAYYAIPPLNTSKGLPTNALYGFLTMSIKLLRDIKPDYIAYCFDRKEKNFRFELYPEYKANRSEMPEDLVPQVPYLRKLTELLGIPLFDKLGFEADDVIGSLARFGRENNLEVIIVSGDKDFAQLVGPYVTMYDPMKEKRYDFEGVVEKWGVKPDQMIDYLALVGDSSDNIPGVRGVGPKGAQKLLSEFKNLNGIYENIEKVPGKSLNQKLRDNKDKAYLSHDLVTIRTEIDFSLELSDLKLKTVERSLLSLTLTELEFSSFEKGLSGTSNGLSQSNNSSTDKPQKKTKKLGSRAKATTKLIDLTQAEEILANAEILENEISAYAEVIALATERGLFLCCGNKIYIVQDALEKLGPVLGKKLLAWSGFDLKEIWRQIELPQGLPPKSDLMLSAYVARAGNIDSFNKVYELYTGEKIPDLATPTQYINYFLEIENLVSKQVAEVKGEEILNEIELPLMPILYEMEAEGIRVDLGELKNQSQFLGDEIDRIEKEVHQLAGESFNVASPKQLAKILFEKLDLEPIKKTKTGFSTDNEVLQKLADSHPICSLIIDYRENAKLKSTYVDSLPHLVDSKTGRVHTHFRQAMTSTGRLSSVNPNLQNIPIRTDKGKLVRKAFVAEEGKVLLSVDYSQIELRVLAHITGDESLCRAFDQDLDIHASTAAEVFGVALDQVTVELRRKAKAVNFGIAYGQGAFGLSESLSISRTEASEIIGNYFGRFRAVKAYMEEAVEKAKKFGYVETIFGRRRYIDELKSKNGTMKKFGERAAINAPIQGTASDLVKKAMIAVANGIDARILLQVHDELLLECEADEVEELAKSVKAIMENIYPLRVPLKANVAWGTNWQDAHA